MNKGDYVRTKQGRIGKISNLTVDYSNELILCEESSIPFGKHQIIKCSPNIIDLIEVGDYVNGVLINDIDVYPSGKVVGYRNSEDLWEDDFKNNEIKSIVTKEQFSAMEYKVESEVK